MLATADKMKYLKVIENRKKRNLGAKIVFFLQKNKKSAFFLKF